MGQTGRILVQEHFGMYSWARRLADIYAEARDARHTNELGTSSP
jgi:hypothetical protein